MFRQHERVAGSYRVNFSPEAWREIGRLPSATFLELQDALEQLAQQARGATPEEANSPQHTFTISSLLIHYERDDQARTLTLHSLTPLPRGSEEEKPQRGPGASAHHRKPDMR
jgi:hypothetical protein